MFYLTIILGSMLLTVIGNLSFSCAVTPSGVLDCILSVVLATASIIILDALVALAIRRLTPKAWYLPSKSFFKVSKGERDFYKRLKIKRWKDLVPELGIFTGFNKNHLQSRDDEEYLFRFILESNYGVIIHIANASLGFLIAFLPFCRAPGIWIPVFAVNFVLSLLPVAVLRYTSHTLIALYQRSQKKKETVN